MGYFCGMAELLIVGDGLAGALVAAKAAERDINCHWMVGSSLPAASMAAYGMCNPVHFRNKVPSWMAEEFYAKSKSFFQKYNNLTGANFFSEIPIHHLVNDEDEFIQWRQQVESTTLWKYTNGEKQTLITQKHALPYEGSIEISACFFLNIPDFIGEMKLRYKDSCLNESFNMDKLKFVSNKWEYNNTRYERIIFAQGHHALKYPFFDDLPFNPCKGEILKLRIPDLSIHVALHKRNVLAPLESEIYSFGATYEWDDLTFEPSFKGREELELTLKQMLGDSYRYEVVEQRAGVRPAMSDRRPVVGWHPVYEDIGILNGFGSRGLLVGPNAAENLLDHWLTGEEILADWNVNRFRKRLIRSTPVF